MGKNERKDLFYDETETKLVEAHAVYTAGADDVSWRSKYNSVCGEILANNAD